MKKQVIKGLRKVATAIYNNDFKGDTGICWEFNPCNRCRLVHSNGYALYVEVTSYMKAHVRKDGFLCKPDTRWKQRAMFCLLLAEMIEQEK